MEEGSAWVSDGVPYENFAASVIGRPFLVVHAFVAKRFAVRTGARVLALAMSTKPRLAGHLIDYPASETGIA